VNNTESAVATVTATMPAEPVVVKFNNSADLVYFTGVSSKSFETYNSNKVFSYPAPNNGDGITYVSVAALSDMYLQGYPFVVVGAYYPYHQTNTIDIYLGTDRVPDDEKSYGFSASYAGMTAICGGELSKTVVNAETRAFTTYSGSTVVASGKASGDGFGGFDKWMGKLTSLRVDFSNGAANAGKISYIDYVGFFPTEAAALAYIGAMPNDAEAESIISAVDTAYEAKELNISYEDGATKESADAFITDLVNEITADVVSQIKASGISNVTVKVTGTELVPGETSKDSGTYTFTLDVIVGDKALRRTDLQKEYTVEVEGKPVTDVYFDDVTVSIGKSVTLTPEIKNITAESYQWYTCDDANGTDPVAIEGATSASYTTPVFENFGYYYYMLTVNGSESGVSAITVGMPTEPVVFMFNNEKDLANWSANQKGMAVVEGKNVFTYIAEDGDASTSFGNLSGYNDFYLQGYPYYVLSAEYPDEGYEDVAFDIYFGADGYDEDYRKEHYGFNFSIVGVKPAVKSGLCKTIINAVTGEYESYCDGVLVKSGKGSNDGFKDFSTVIGKFATLRVDFINNAQNTGFKCNAEYLGFFPTKEMALAYTGAMPNDYEANAIIAAIDSAKKNGTLKASYESASTEAEVEAYIAGLIDEITAEAVADANEKGIQTVEFSIVDTDYEAGETIYDDGSYTFTVDLLVGDKPFKRTRIRKEYTIVVQGKSMGAVFIPDVVVAVGASSELSARLNGINGESYQWYTVDDAEGTNPEIIEGANSITYNTGYLNTKGIYYYKLVVNETESAIAKVTVDMPTEPVVLMFNNKADLAYWSAGDTKKLVNIDGKTAFAYTPGNNDGATSFSNLSKYNDFYLQGYPYFVVSASYPNHTNLTFDIYIGADGYDAEYRKNHYNFNFSVSGVKPAADQGFCKTVINAFTGAYKSYNAEGKVVSEGKGSPDGFMSADTLLGKLATLRVDFSNGNANKECYIEYLGFFPTEEMAVAYNGAMPEDASAKLLTDAVEAAEANGDFALRFSESEKEYAVAEKAAALVTALTAETIAELKEEYETVEFTVANEEYVRPAPYGKGTYNFDAQALVGDKIFGRSLVSTKVTMELGEKPEPVVLKFDTQEKVTAAGVGKFIAAGTVLEGNEEKEDRSYMRLDLKENANGIEVNYVNFYDQTGKTFNFQDYPYMKISYRRDRPSSLNGTEAIMIYATDNSPSYFIYPNVKADSEPYWEQLVVDMRQNDVANAITYYQEDTGSTTTGTLIGNNKTRNWADTPVISGKNPLAFRLTRYGTSARVIDYEYIAFFASKDEATMFPRELPNNASYDVETLTAKNTFAAAMNVRTKAQAEQAAAEYLENFVFATKANIDYENAVFTAPTSEAAGSYVFDVWFGTERDEEFTVTVTMTMAQLPAPVIMYADSTAVLSSVKADNASLKLEDGVIK
ncbi:MAG: hypothetical protein IJO52_05260, partial [Clostridia bacterium]|nr:hypothetical protein [Clostridia bacterium]